MENTSISAFVNVLLTRFAEYIIRTPVTIPPTNMHVGGIKYDLENKRKPGLQSDRAR